jgi:hypothetical protein
MTSGPCRIATIFCVALAWFVASNHCGLAALAQVPVEHACCEKSPPVKSAPDEGMVCCDDLVAPLPAEAALPLDFSLAAVQPEGEIAAGLVAGSQREDFVIVRGSAPPRGDFLVGVLLQRIVPAHAPPCRVV